MKGWKEIEFTKSILQNTVSRSNQINASEILDNGYFPVIDQGKAYIAGYTNDESKLIKDGLPYIIFGDHTRCFKYIDFPFVVGADGTKVLSPNTDLFEPKFFYFQLLSLDIQNRGYNRHFKLLKEKKLKAPKLPEQRKIAYVLSTVQKAIEQQDKLIRTTTELKKALMQKLFTEGLHGEKQKETEIGLVPESWEVVEIGEMYNFTKKTRGLKIEKPIPFIPMELISFDNMRIQNFEMREKVSSGTYVEDGDLLLAKITPSFENGKQGFVDIGKPFAFATTEVIPIKEKNNISNKYYLFYYLLKDDVRSTLTGKMEGSTGRQRLSKTVLANTLIPKPSIDEQVEIAEIFKTLDKKVSVAISKKQTLSDLFKTLLHELMTGQRRVNEIDFGLRLRSAHEPKQAQPEKEDNQKK